jgi:tetratricopeptide (TPR) repeat protein
MASAALRVDDLDNAAKYITMALKREKQSVTLLDNAGKIAMQREQYDEAERYLKKAVKKAPKFFRPYLSLADLERLRENYTKAFDYIDQAMELEPDRAEPFASSGMLHLRMEQYEKAKKDLEKAISLQRNNNYARLYLGRTYGKLGEIPKAEEALKLVLKDDDYRDAAQIELAQLYNDAGQYPKALSSIDTYLKIKPKNAEGWRLKGLILSNMGNEREAQRAYTQATSLDSGDAVSYINQAVMFFNKQDFNGVLRVAQQAENNKIKDPKISNMKVVALINLQKASDIPKAIKEAEKAGVAPSTIAQFNGQYQMTVEGDYEAAIAFFDEAIKKDGKNGLAYYYRAFCYANLGDIAKAKADASTGKRVGDEQAKASCQNLLDQLK